MEELEVGQRKARDEDGESEDGEEEVVVEEATKEKESIIEQFLARFSPTRVRARSPPLRFCR